MRVLVLGANGMLGHKLMQVMSDGFETFGTIRGSVLDAYQLPPFSRGSLIGGIDVTQEGLLEELLPAVAPDVVINAVGLVKQRLEAEDAVLSRALNKDLPHRVAEICGRIGSRAVFISTDCVFSGERGGYTEEDQPDATDLYGMNKRLGEILTGNSVTFRTSIIGRELKGAQGLVEWFLGNCGMAVKGFPNAIFSGVPTVVLAEFLKTVIIDFPELRGLYHLSGEPISKFHLLELLNSAFACGTVIERDESVRVDRSLDSSRLSKTTGVKFAGWPELVERLKADSQGYEDWRKR